MSVKSSLVLAAVFSVAACGVTPTAQTPVKPVTNVPSATPTAPTPSKPAARSRTKLPDRYDPERNAAADIAAALAKAKKDRLPVLLDFGADWCPECHELHRLFRTGTVRPIVGAYHVVAIEVGRVDRRLDLAQKYGLVLKQTGIPAVVVLSPEGEVRYAGNTGLYRNADSTDEKTPDSVAAFLRRFQ